MPSKDGLIFHLTYLMYVSYRGLLFVLLEYNIICSHKFLALFLCYVTLQLDILHLLFPHFWLIYFSHYVAVLTIRQSKYFCWSGSIYVCFFRSL